jgi:heterodisulfide reductase subunit A-like polyferredoxin
MYTINQYCVGCHYCADECPVSAINFVGTKYEIDPGRCTSCGSCVSLCPISAISDPEHPVPPAPQHPPIERYCDVVVLGGGCGLIAAVRAAEAGKKVILLEKAKKVGGNTDLAHMFFPLYPQVFAEQGLPDVREDAIEILHDRSK